MRRKYRVSVIKAAGRQLRAWRLRGGREIGRCAAIVGVTATVWSAWECGRYRPLFDSALALEGMTEIPVEAWDYPETTARWLMSVAQSRRVRERQLDPRVYIAANYRRRDEAIALDAELTARKFRVVSTWYTWPLETKPESELSRVERQQRANDCERDLNTATALVMLVSPPMRGTIAEFGIARGTSLPIFAVGDPFDSTLMLDLLGVQWVNTTTVVDALLALREARCETETTAFLRKLAALDAG